MVEVLFVILIAWTVITLVGHGTWVLLQTIIGLVSGPKLDHSNAAQFEKMRAEKSKSSTQPDAEADHLAFCRMVDALQATGRMTAEAASGLKADSRQLASSHTPPKPAQFRRSDLLDKVREQDSRPNSTVDPPAAIPTKDQTLDSTVDRPRTLTRPRPDARREPKPLMTTRQVIQPPAEPKRPLSDVVTAFLADHNIRWGEIVAGMLVVVCSIGLVVSLWSTLTATHRVVPSLIFISADAAIFAAGLYTMRRWRLRHTSRAVLIIATLLVPLCVLAGLAAAGASLESVSLTDPVTLLAIGAGMLGCGCLLWQSSLALVGRGNAAAMVVSVMAPSLCLPLLPGLARMLGPWTGGIIVLPAMAVAFAWSWPLRQRKANRAVGSRSIKNRWWLMGIGSASMASLIAYAVYLYTPLGQAIWLQIAIAAIPIFVAITMSNLIELRSSSGIPRLVATVLACLGIGFVIAILPASIGHLRYLIAHGLIAAASIAGIAEILRRRKWILGSAAPLGIAGMLSAPAWLGGQDWSNVAVWQSIIGGEPMLVAVFVGAVLAIVGWKWQPAGLKLAAGFLGIAMVQSVLLTFAPDTWRGLVNAPVLAAIQGLLAVASSLMLRSEPRVRYCTLMGWACAWATLLGLGQWDGESVHFDLRSLTMATAGLSASLLATIYLAKRIFLLGNVNEQHTHSPGSAPKDWTDAIGFLASCAGIAAITMVATRVRLTLGTVELQEVWQTEWLHLAAWTTGGCALMVLAGWLARQRAWWQAAMLTTVVGVMALQAYVGSGSVYMTTAWQNGNTFWTLASALLISSAIWSALRELPRIKSDEPGTVLGDRRSMPDGWSLMSAVMIVSMLILCQYLAILIRPMIDRKLIGIGFGLENFDSIETWQSKLVCVIAMLVAWCQAIEPSAMFRRGLSVISVVIGLVASLALSQFITPTASGQLIATTTLAVSFILMAGIAVRQSDWLSSKIALGSSEIGRATIYAMVALASVVLLASDWWPSIRDSTTIPMTSTVAVAAWWAIAALSLLWSTRRLEEQNPIAQRRVMVSGMLLPAATFLTASLWTDVGTLVWLQASALGGLLWIVIDRRTEILAFMRLGNSPKSNQLPITSSFVIKPRDFNVIWVGLIGLIGCIMSIMTVVTDDSAAGAWTLPLGVIVSAAAIAVWAFRGLRWPAIPIAVSLLSGHFGHLLFAAGFVTWQATGIIIVCVGVLAGLLSIILVWWKIPRVGASLLNLQDERYLTSHAMLSGIGIAWWSILSLGPGRGTLGGYFADWLTALIALAGLVVAGIACLRKSNWSRFAGWHVLWAGGFLLVQRLVDPASGVTAVAILSVWFTAWCLGWRSDRVLEKATSPGGEHRFAMFGLRADREAAGSLLVGVIAVISFQLFDWSRLALSDSDFWLSGIVLTITAWLASLSIVALPRTSHRDRVTSIGLLCGGGVITALLGTGILDAFSDAQLPLVARWSMASVGGCGAVVIAILSLPAFRRWWPIPRTNHVNAEQPANVAAIPDPAYATLHRTLLTLLPLASCVPAMIAVRLTGGSSIESSTIELQWLRLSILPLCGLSFGLFLLAQRTHFGERTDGARVAHANTFRKQCVLAGLWAIGLFAALGSVSPSLPLLVGSMRVLIASTLSVVVLILVLPRLLAQSFITSWMPAIRVGGITAGAVALGSLATMLVSEAITRQTDIGIPELPMPLVVVVGVMLGVLAIVSAVVAVLGGPDEQTARISLAPDQRRRLLYIAQAIGVATWLHLFLCRAGIAFLGLRQVWPYIVMLIAFASVGLTQWAIRRGDKVLRETMERTAMFLPMIPVIGFWLSGSYATLWEDNPWSWTFYRGAASYQGLLLVAAIYYGVMSMLWKKGLPRVASILLANIALWVTLTQVPGWDFLAHPQAWLIPPAVCVLIVAYLQRDSLGNELSKTIRYGATLTIYLSSTADMLLSDIGASLWGPVVLIILSLAGMTMGVALRIKPFLYLGTVFVFLGVTSMVWHAGQAIDAVWPWWVFGITTGILLLCGLAAIERNRPKLQLWADRLATWES